MSFYLPDVKEFLRELDESGEPAPQTISAEEAREQFLSLVRAVDAPAPGIGSRTDIVIEKNGHAIPARIYDPVPRDRGARPVILYFHGGGWMLGDLETHDSLCAEIASETGVAVVAVDYRLSPEYRFPAAHDDCSAAVEWVFDQPASLGFPVSGIALAGDSAGGCMAAFITQHFRGREVIPFVAQFLIYPGTDLARCEKYASYDLYAEGHFLEADLIHYFLDAYVPDGAESAGLQMSPLNGDLSNLPPAVVMTCGLDPIRDQGRAYAAKLIESGNQVSYHEQLGQIHACLCFRAALPSAQSQLRTCLVDFSKFIAAFS